MLKAKGSWYTSSVIYLTVDLFKTLCVRAVYNQLYAE